MRNLLLLMVTLSACVTPKAHQNWESAFKHGEAAFHEGNYADAITRFKEATRHNKWAAEGWHYLGLAYFAAESYELAEQPLLKAVELASDGYPEARMNLGTLYLAQERFSAAIEELEAAANNPEYREPARARHNLGWAYYNVGRFSDARGAYRQVLRTFPRFCPALRGLGMVDEAEGKLDDALVRYQQAFECDGTDLQTHLSLGILEARLDLVADACEHLNMVKEIDRFGELRDQASEVLAMLDCKGGKR